MKKLIALCAFMFLAIGIALTWGMITRVDAKIDNPGDGGDVALNAASFQNHGRGAGPFSSGPAASGFCPGPNLTVLPNDGNTSPNARAPQTKNRFERGVYLITASEMAAAGYVAGSSPTSIGWNYQTGGTSDQQAPLTVYLQNTSDTTNTKSTTWTTAITAMTVVHNANTTLPAAAGPFNITLTGGSPFTYTGGGLYVAFDWGGYNGTLSTTTVVLVNLALANGSLGGQNNVAPPGTLGAAAGRPETRLGGGNVVVPQNDAAVSAVYSYGELPLGRATQATGAVITNPGASTLTNLPVSLNIGGTSPFTDTQNVPSIAPCGGTATVTFASFNPTAVGSDTVTVSVPPDDNAANNSSSKPLNVTPKDYSYKYPGSALTGGVGFDGGTTGTIVAKFKATAADPLTAVKLEFAAATATTYRVAIYGDNGGVPSTTALYTDAVDRTVSAAGPVTITLPVPVPVGPGNFYVGIQQTNTTNAQLSYDSESPIRSGSFFAGASPPVSWIDIAPGNNFKVNIGLIFQDGPTAAAVTISGRVITHEGDGIRGARVSLTDMYGVSRTAVTNAFGYYTFTNVQSGANYLMGASARRYLFGTRVLNLSDSLGEINFVDGQ